MWRSSRNFHESHWPTFYLPRAAKSYPSILHHPGGWRGSWHCLSGEHLLCILFSRPELRKTACTGRFESCGCQPIMLKITAWPVG